MPTVTLVLWLLYLAISLGARIVIQLRTTGSSGFVLLRRGSSRLQRVASAVFVSALWAGLCSPVLALTYPEHTFWAPWSLPPALLVVGGIFYVGGVALAFTAQLTLGRAWRIGVDAEERTELITRGAFRVVRNPIFSALQLTAVGLALLCSTPLAWLACVVQLLALELQVRGVEEPHLARRHAAAYLEYAAKVGRFVPGIGLRPKLWTAVLPRRD